MDNLPLLILRYAGLGLITAAAFGMAYGREGFGYVALGGLILLMYSVVGRWIIMRKAQAAGLPTRI